MVRSVGCGARWSHESIRKLPQRSSKYNFERRDRAKNSETSTGGTLILHQTIVSMLLFRASSSSPGVNDEMMEAMVSTSDLR